MTGVSSRILTNSALSEVEGGRGRELNLPKNEGSRDYGLMDAVSGLTFRREEGSNDWNDTNILNMLLTDVKIRSSL